METTDSDSAGMLAQFVESCLVDEAWAQRAVHATTAEDLFVDDPA